MTVNEWFESGKDYQTGIQLYSTLKGAKPNLLRLFFKKQSKPNEAKLEYELSKHRVSSELPSSEIVPDTTPDIIISKPLPAPIVKTKSKTNFFYNLKDLHISLHEKARHQRDIFQEAISLKMQLNDLHELEEAKALKISIRIEDIFDEMDAIQQILKHYVDHKTVLDVSAETFEDLSPAQLLQRRNTKRASLSKLRTRIKKLKDDLTTDLPIATKTKKEVALEKAEAKMIKINSDIVEFNKLINN